MRGKTFLKISHDEDVGHALTSLRVTRFAGEGQIVPNGSQTLQQKVSSKLTLGNDTHQQERKTKQPPPVVM